MRSEELFTRHSGDKLSGSQTEFSAISSVLIRETHQVIPQLHFSFSEREIGSSQGVPKVTGADGLYSGHNSSVRRQNGAGGVVSFSEGKPHNLPGATNGVPSLKPLYSFPSGISCADQIRQHNGGGLHKQTGGYALPTASQSSSQTNCVEQHSVSVASCNTRAKNNEQGSGSVVQRESPLRRMETSPTGGDSVVAEIRTGCRRSLCIVPSVLFPSGRRSGCGCSSAPVEIFHPAPHKVALWVWPVKG